jgi:hypothetical protein
MNRQVFVSMARSIEKSAAQLYTTASNVRQSGDGQTPPQGLLLGAAGIVGLAAEVKALADVLLAFTQAAVLKDDAL